MIIATEAIVISAIKYGDTSLIVKCLTAAGGIKTYILKGILASRKGTLKAAHFQPLTQLDIVAIHKSKSNLHHLREAKVSYACKTIYTDPKKNAIALFLSEVLNHALYGEEEDKNMFQYIKEALQWLDTHKEIANFHILFLLNLTKYLGFYPDTNNQDYPYFDLQEGKFIPSPSLNPVIKGENTAIFKAFLGMNFDAVFTIKISKEDRQELLYILISYFQLHLYGFKNPKSIGVLHQVFS